MKLPLSDRMIPPSAALAAILLAFGFPAMSPIRVVGNITVELVSSDRLSSHHC